MQTSVTSKAPPPLPDPNAAIFTYLRSVALLVPTVFVWLFANSFMIPKLEQVWQIAGLTGSKAQFLLDSSFGLQKTIPVLLFAAVILILILESRWSAWPRYRRFAVAGTTLLLHTVVLVGVTAIATAALIAVPRALVGKAAKPASAVGVSPTLSE